MSVTIASTAQTRGEMKSVLPPQGQVRQPPQPNASRPQQPPKVKPAPLPKCLQCDRQSGHSSGICSKCRFPGARGRASTTVFSTSPTTVLVTSASCALSSETTTCTPTAPSENTIISTTSTNSGSLAPRIAPGAPRLITAGARKHRHAARGEMVQAYLLVTLGRRSVASCSAATALSLRGHLLSCLSGMLVEHALHDGNEVCAQVLHAPRWPRNPVASR